MKTKTQHDSMTYYKKNGFFDLLERLSMWIDREKKGFRYHYQTYGILYFVPGFRRISLINSWIGNFEEEIKEIIADREFYRKMYNREKYWWMRKK